MCGFRNWRLDHWIYNRNNIARNNKLKYKIIVGERQNNYSSNKFILQMINSN